jgi:hypothetical protein
MDFMETAEICVDVYGCKMENEGLNIDALSAAQNAVQRSLRRLKRVNINELKAYSSPSYRVLMVGDLVCAFLGKPRNWNEFRKLTQTGELIGTAATLTIVYNAC